MGSARSARKAPAKRLPEDWAPTDAHRKKAAELGVDLELEADRFRLHAEANDRRAVRWDAAFSMWLTNAKPTLRAVPPASAEPPPPIAPPNHWGTYD